MMFLVLLLETVAVKQILTDQRLKKPIQIIIDLLSLQGHTISQIDPVQEPMISLEEVQTLQYSIIQEIALSLQVIQEAAVVLREAVPAQADHLLVEEAVQEVAEAAIAAEVLLLSQIVQEGQDNLEFGFIILTIRKVDGLNTSLSTFFMRVLPIQSI